MWIDMETDSFFYRLFNDLPQAFFELIGEPAERAKSYRFDSVELKKAYRIDGLFLPSKRTLPIYFVEVQFQRRASFYANLFAKVFTYLNENDPMQEWVAVAIFPTGNEEPVHHAPYEDLLASRRVKRVYLENVTTAKDSPVGLEVLQLLFASEVEAQHLAPRVVRKAKAELADSDLQAKVVELVERVLMTRFTGLDVEEIRMKFKLHDIRKSKAWQQLRDEGLKEGREEGREKGREEGREEGDARRLKKTIETLLGKGKTLGEIADLLDIPVKELRQVARNGTHRKT
jgi:predicted transposase/invertase (TIGR01784 family)